MTNTKAAGAQTSTSNVLSPDTAKLGKVIYNQWVGKKLYIDLGIREKTALGTGTRAAMLAVAAYGYAPGQGRVLAMAVRQAMGLDPNVGGIDFPWLEKAVNMRTITPLATVRLDSKDGKMRLSPIGKAQAPKAPKSTPSKVKAQSERVNGPVTVTRESDAVRAAAMADIASELGNVEG